jgi:RhtB (resistance to homoserine/threonine) family protein
LVPVDFLLSRLNSVRTAALDFKAGDVLEPSLEMNSMTFVPVTLVGLLAVISPGPDFIIVTRNSLLYSKRAGLFTTFGIVVGNVWWVAASILGLSYVLAQSVAIFSALKLLGALYLIYLGVRSLRLRKKVPEDAGPETSPSQKPKDLTATSAFNMGLWNNLLNAKCALFYSSFFSIIITPETPALFRWMFGLEITIIALVWFSLLSTALSFDTVRSVFARWSTTLDRLTGAILIGLGLKLILARAK